MNNERTIPIGMISDDNFIMPTSVAITSIILNKAEETHYEIYVLMAECSEESKRRINELNNLSEKCNVNIIEVSLDKYKDIKQLAHIPIACLLKFDICDIISDYDKLLYLDGDIIVRSDLWELYNTDLDGNYAAAVKEMYCVENDNGNINAGVMLFNAKKIREEGLRDKFLEIRKSLGDRGSMDQQTFNIMFKGRYYYVDIKYNCVPGRLTESLDTQYGIGIVNKIYHTNYESIKRIYDDAVIVHYATATKPWIYTFIPEAKEWYSYYLRSPFKKEPFKLMGRWEFRIKKYINIIQRDGIRGIASALCELKRRKCRKDKNNGKFNDGWG